LWRDTIIASNTVHGLVNHELYRTWQQMIARCENPRNPGFANYGARGIKVCPRWHSLPAFLADMGERPPGTSLDRKDNAGNYEPSNCRWGTRQQQNRNQRAKRSNSSGFTGVYRLRSGNYCARIRVNGRDLHLGVFPTLREAIAARLAAQDRHGFSFWHGSVPRRRLQSHPASNLSEQAPP
jgi:hypothetical protein